MCRVGRCALCAVKGLDKESMHLSFGIPFLSLLMSSSSNIKFSALRRYRLKLAVSNIGIKFSHSLHKSQMHGTPHAKEPSFFKLKKKSEYKHTLRCVRQCCIYN